MDKEFLLLAVFVVVGLTSCHVSEDYNNRIQYESELEYNLRIQEMEHEKSCSQE